MGNPFIHMELTADDVAAAKKFYSKLFDWKLKDMGVGGQTYTMIDVGKGVGGGMQTRPMPGAPTGWLTYVQVDSVKKSIARAAKLGAKILLEYHAIPNMGALGVFADPQGSMMGVWEQAAPARTAKKGTAKKAAAKKAPAKKRAGKGGKKKK